MTETLFLEDSYMKEFEAEVKEVNDEKFIVLDKTAFYPKGGGQPHDTGTLKTEDNTYNVVFTGKFSGEISHEVDKPGLKVGDNVHCIIDWERRYKLMRSHTAAHIISTVIYKDTGAMITGNQLDIEKCRIDFSLEEFNADKVSEWIDHANKIIQQDLKVSYKSMPREEAMQLPQISKLAKGLPESIKTLRIVSIGDFDIQADGGTHINSTKEIGRIALLKTDNKGKNNRRLYFTLE